LDGLSFLSINVGERNWMEREFESEVLGVMREFNGVKAPGLASFLLLFSRSVGRYQKRTLWKFLRSFINERSLKRALMLLLCPSSLRKHTLRRPR
jgi:hypothetical protein